MLTNYTRFSRSPGSILLFLLFAASFVACKNTEADLIEYKIDGKHAITEIDPSNFEILVNFPEGVSSADSLAANFIISEDADAFVGNNLQISGVTVNNYEKPFTFQVVSEDQQVSNPWKVKSSNNDFTEKWGLGGFLKKNVALNRDYEWYINQAETGTFSDVNCAPSSVVMVSHWSNENFSHSVEDARGMYNPKGGGWYTTDIQNCLLDFNIDHTIIELATSKEETSEIIQDQLNAGNILMICIDIHYLRLCENDSLRVDKYYETIALGTGHSIVIKGFKVVDGHVFFEIYDPAGYNFKYAGGQSKGKDRYYRGEDIFTATFGRWNYAFVIAGPENTLMGVSKSLKLSEIPSILIL